MAYFPMFVDLKNKKCLLVGGGRIAYRKLCTLLDFEAKVILVSPYIDKEIKLMAKESPCNIILMEREFSPEDCFDMDLVVSATDDASVNERVSNLCREYKIPVNVVDDREISTFIFPSYAKEQNLVAAFSSGGNSPLITQILREKAQKELLSPLLGEINECLGTARARVRSEVDDPDIAREIYEEIYKESLDKKEALSPERVREIIDGYVL